MTDTLKKPVDADRIARVRGSLKMLEAKLGETHARIISDAEQLIYDLTPSPSPKMALSNDGSAIPDLPEKVWIDPRDLSIHYTEGNGRLAFVSAPEPKRPKHHKTDEDVARIRALAEKGLNQKEIAKALNVHPRTVRKFVGRVYGQHQAAFTPAEITEILEKANG